MAVPLRVVPSSTGLPSKRCPQLVKNPPALQETPVQFLGLEGPLAMERLALCPQLQFEEGRGAALTVAACRAQLGTGSG